MEASPEQMNFIGVILNEFCAVSRQRVSANRTVIYFRQNVYAIERDAILQVEPFLIGF